MATREHIKNIIAYLKLNFANYNPDVTSPLNAVDVLYDLLGDLSAEELQVGVKACCLEYGRAFAPSAGEIRGKVAQMRLAANHTPSAGEAWNEVMQHIKNNGCRATPSWSHPIIGQAVDAIGLVNIGMSEDAMIERAHFLKLFPTYLQRETDRIAQHPQITAVILEWQQNLLEQNDVRELMSGLNDKLAVSK